MTEVAKPLQAFYCEAHEDPETAEIIFATSNVAARRRFTDQEGCEFGDATVHRKPLFDQYAPGPVPLKALLEDGWFSHCTACGQRISYLDDDTWLDPRDPLAIIKEVAEHNAKVDAELAKFDKARAESDHASDENYRHACNDRYARHAIEARKFPRLLDMKALRFHTNLVFCNLDCEQNHYNEIARINLAHEQAEQTAAQLFPQGHGFESKRYPYLEPHVTFRVEGLTYPVSWKPDQPDAAWVSNGDKAAWDAILAKRSEMKEMADGPREA